MTASDAAARLREVVARAGALTVCRFCGATVYRIVHRGLPKNSDNTYPAGVYDADGGDHWDTCPSTYKAQRPAE